MARSNSSRILHRLIASGPATRGELGDELDMSAATVTRTVRPMIARGILEPLSVRGSDATTGKPAYLLGIVPTCAAFIGVKVTDSTAFAVVTDMSGRVLEENTRDLSGTSQQTVEEAIATLVADFSGDRHIAGVGVGLGGRVENGVVLASGILGWKDAPLEVSLEQRLGTTVTLSNDVRAFAQAESWWGAGRGSRSFVLVSMGTGIGSCTVIDGTVFAGEHDTAGLIGHLQITDHGPRCESGHIGCARAYASSTCILRGLSEQHGIHETYEEFLSHALAGRDPEREIAENAVDAMAQVVSGATAFLDPDAVVVSGDGVSLLLAFAQRFQRQIDAHRHWQSAKVPVMLRRMEFFTWAQGAAAAAMERWTQSI